MKDAEARARLEYLRGELRAERISWGEIAELQSLAGYIDPGDVELLEAAGVPEAVPGDDARAMHLANAREEGIPERDALEGIPHESAEDRVEREQRERDEPLASEIGLSALLDSNEGEL